MAEENIPRTVFVLGAGASCELGLPIGSALKTLIATELDIRFGYGGTRQISGNERITDAFRLAVADFAPPSRDINPLLHICWQLRDAMPQAISIDNYLDALGDEPLMEICGKAGIATAIVGAEANSRLASRLVSGSVNTDFAALENTWHNSFCQLLTENCKRDDLSKRLRSVAVIVFNYDRCFEVFLLRWLINYYKLQPQDAMSLVKQVEIYHPYGMVGGLDGINVGSASIPFGGELRGGDIYAISKVLKTFTEGTDESSSDIIRIRQLMANSQRVVFLGFAYHRLNMKLLFEAPLGLGPTANRKVFGTALKISSKDVEIIEGELAEYLEMTVNDIELRNDLDCVSLFKEYWRSLSFV